MAAQDAVITMTVEELKALPVSVDLVTAARAFGMGRTKAHTLARSGQFPCEVLRVGHSYRVTRSALLEALGISPTCLEAMTGAAWDAAQSGEQVPA